MSAIRKKSIRIYLSRQCVTNNGRKFRDLIRPQISSKNTQTGCVALTDDKDNIVSHPEKVASVFVFVFFFVLFCFVFLLFFFQFSLFSLLHIVYIFFCYLLIVIHNSPESGGNKDHTIGNPDEINEGTDTHLG